MIKYEKMEFLIIKFLILYMPLHYMICEILLKNYSFDNILRDIIIISLFIMHIYKKGIKVNSIGLIIFIIMIIMTFFMLFSVLQGNLYSINIYRTYTVPALLYFIIKDIRPNKIEINKLIQTSITEMSLIAIWGIFQSLVLGDGFLVKIGYPTVNGILGASFYINGYYGIQRSVGTFVSANYCGLIMAVFLLIAMFSMYYKAVKIKGYKILILMGGMLSTISRSAILAFIISLFYFYMLCERNISKTFYKNLILIIVLGSIILIVMDSIIFKGVLVNMLSDALLSALSFSDLSSQKHLSDLTEPLGQMLDNPLGLGFGYNGPMAIEHVKNSRNIESSIFLIVYEIGSICGFIYFIPFIRCFVLAPFKRNKIKKVSATIILLILITFIFLPNVQSFEVLFYLYIFTGIFDNQIILCNYNYREKIEFKGEY